LALQRESVARGRGGRTLAGRTRQHRALELTLPYSSIASRVDLADFERNIDDRQRAGWRSSTAIFSSHSAATEIFPKPTARTSTTRR
jgi:hypothetical protein